MNTQNIPWHNPDNLTPEQVGEGWRLITKDELKGPPFDAEIYSDNKWESRDGFFVGAKLHPLTTCRTREPLPAKYRSEFTPIPEGLPPLRAFDSATHWPKYEGLGENLEIRPIWDGFMLGNENEWQRVDCCGAIWGFHYVALAPIDYADPEYRAYVEDAFLKGAKIEIRSRSGLCDWTKWTWPCWDWEDWNYRIAPAQPAPEKAMELEPDHDSRKYKKRVLDAVWDGIECESFLPGKREWSPANIHQIVFAISRGLKVRIKPTPPEPVFDTVPLDFNDWLNGPWEVCSEPEAPYPTIDLVVAFNHLDICTASHGCEPILTRTRHDEAMELWRRKVGVSIWGKCSKQVERKG